MDTVLVTGFGPFGNFPINASWEVAKELRNLDFEGNKIHLITEEIPVVYETVRSKVPALWELHKPKLTVHIGVSAYAEELTLETCAHKLGYERPDVEGKLPDKPLEADPSIVKACFDLEEISIQFNATNKDGVTSVVSKDAGRYLCEYTFYTSLCLQTNRTVFIHVPDIGKPFSVAQMARGVRELILLIVDQVNKMCP